MDDVSTPPVLCPQDSVATPEDPAAEASAPQDEHPDQTEPPAQAEQPDRTGPSTQDKRPDSPEQPDQTEQPDQDKSDQTEQSDPAEPPDQTEPPAQTEQPDQTEPPTQDEPDQAEPSAQVEPSTQTEQPDPAEHPDETEPPAQGEPAPSEPPAQDEPAQTEPPAPSEPPAQAEPPVQDEPAPSEPPAQAEPEAGPDRHSGLLGLLRAPRRRILWVSAAALLLGVGVGGYAYASYYADVAAPHTTVAGTDVSGMSREEIATLVRSRAESVTVSVTGDVSATASLAQLGTTVDAEATAQAAIAPSSSVLHRLTALVSPTSIDVVTATDPMVTADYAQSLVPEGRTRARNADLALGDDGETFEVVPGSEGVGLDTQALQTAVDTAASTLSGTKVSLSLATVTPEVTDEMAAAVARSANSMVAHSVTLTGPEEAFLTADLPTKASWVVTTSHPHTAPTLSVNVSEVESWIRTKAAFLNVDSVTGKRYVDPSGNVAAVPVQAQDGRHVSNAEALATAAAAALEAGTDYSGTLETATDTAAWQDKLIDYGAQDLAYPAAPGEKWIDIDLSKATTTAYEGSSVVHGPVPMVPGSPDHPTVTGTYAVYLKYAAQDMGCTPGWPYCARGVPWVSYWHESYALHGAPWQHTFGWSGPGGSHGCINLPVSEAKWFYDWDEIGTPVVSHY